MLHYEWQAGRRLGVVLENGHVVGELQLVADDRERLVQNGPVLVCGQSVRHAGSLGAQSGILGGQARRALRRVSSELQFNSYHFYCFYAPSILLFLTRTLIRPAGVMFAQQTAEVIKK